MRFISFIVIIAIVTTMVAGCRSAGDNSGDSIDYTYIPEMISFPELPGEFTEIGNIAFFDDSVYFTAMNVPASDTDIRAHSIFSMNMDGTNLFELIEYSEIVSRYTTAESVSIDTLITDIEGNIWILGTIFHGYHSGIPNRILVRKLDNKGVEILSFDITGNTTETDGNIRDFNVDNDENVYIGIGNRILIFDKSGSLLFYLNVRGNTKQIIRMPDGTVAVYDWQGSLQKIDVEKQIWGDKVDIPPGTRSVFPGNDILNVLFVTGTTLNGFDIKTDEIVPILDFINIDVMFDEMRNVKLLPDGHIIVVTETRGEIFTEPLIELIMLIETPLTEHQDRIPITLAGINIDGLIRSAVIQFNRTSSTHRIHVTDYAVFNTSAESNAGITKLSIEIITGKVPDILVLSDLPFRHYTTRGLFADLNPFFDNDPGINREDLIENVLRVAQTENALYQIFPAFGISTAIGDPNIIGSSPGWTLDDFKAVLYANPRADIPMGERMTKEQFLDLVLLNSMDQFVDWDSATVHFDRGDFAKLLEFADMFPKEYDQSTISGFGDGAISVAEGRQLLVPMGIAQFYAYRLNRAFFRDEFVFKGFPGETGTGSAFFAYGSVAITSQSSSQQEAWEFIKIMLSEDFGREHIHMALPVNRKIFEEKLEKDMDPSISSSLVLTNGFELDIPEISVDEADRLRTLIDSITGMLDQDEILLNIIRENASDFFNGRNTAQEAARIIQSRASIYMSELSG